MQEDDDPIRVLRVISRLNVGGPAIQVITLAKLLESRGYSTTLVRGQEGPREGTMDSLADELGVRPFKLPGLRRELGLHDVRALLGLLRVIRRTRPDVLHTHAAKAGTLGRLAALMALRARPRVIVHTFHGHVFEGVFPSRLAARVIVLIERLLAPLTTRFVAVSSEVGDDLDRYGVAAPKKVSVIRLGFDLSRFKLDDDRRQSERLALRRSLGIPPNARVVTIVARVVQMKRIDRFIRVAGRLEDMTDVWFLVVGDGEQRAAIEWSAEARGLGARLVWAGMRGDVAAVCAATDVMVLTSDNEGTPVAFIEAQAAGLPVVGPDVGGMATVVEDGKTGRVIPQGDEEGLATAVRALLEDPAMRNRMGEAGQVRAFDRFGIDRLVDDVDALYRELLDHR